MGRITNGVKAGAVAGVAYGVLVAALLYLTLSSMKGSVMPIFAQYVPEGAQFTVEQLYSMALIVAPIVMLVIGVVGGAILGAIYGRLFERIPGEGPVVRGFVFGLVLWAISSVLGGLGDLRYGPEYYGIQVAIGFFASLIFGLLLGYFYGRFSSFMSPAEGDSEVIGPAASCWRSRLRPR